MSARFLCKKCKTIVESKSPDDQVDCKCGHLSVIGNKPPISISGDKDFYALVDDNGDEIFVKEDFTHMGDEDVYKELMKALEYQIDSMESSSPGRKFSPCTNQDLLAQQIWLREMMVCLFRLLKRSPPDA